MDQQGLTFESDTLPQRPDVRRWLHLVASPLNDTVVVGFSDITQRSEEHRALREAKPASRYRILLADNNRDASDRFALLPGLGGNELQVTCAGSEALADYKRLQPQLAFVDMRMSEHSAAELTQLTRRQQQAPITLVAASNLSRQQNRERALHAGLDEQMIKPIHHPQRQAHVDAVSSAPLQATPA